MKHKAYIIYLKDGMILSKKEYGSWQEIIGIHSF